MSDKSDQPEHQRPASRAGQALILMSSLVSASVVTLALIELQGVIRPFIIAIFLSLLVKPLTRRLSRRAGVFGYAFACVLIFGVFSIGDTIISADLASFSHNRTTYMKNIEGFKESFDTFVGKREYLLEFLAVEPAPGGDTEDPNATADKPAASPSDLILSDQRMKSLLNPRAISQLLGGGASFVFGIFGEMLVVLIMMLLLLLESDRLPGRLRSVYGEERAERILDVSRHVARSVTRYVSLKVWVSLLTALICVVVMSIFDLHYPITFGILVFLLNFIPYVGSVLATILPCLVALLQFGSPWTALWLATSLTVAQQIVGNFIEPRIQGKGLSISPVVIVLALGFWGWLWGIGGMVLAVPITVTLRIILEQFQTTRQVALMMGSGE